MLVTKQLLYSATLGAFLMFNAACNNGTQKEAPTGQNKDTVSTVTSQLPESFYKRLEGSIANQPIVMHLYRTNDRCEGLYYYTSQGKWLGLNYVQDSSTANRIYMTEKDATAIYTGLEDVKDAILILQYQDGIFKGTWHNGTQAYTFELKENYPPGSHRFNMQASIDSAQAFPGKANTPIARISEFFPVSTSKDLQWFNKGIKKILDFDTSQTDFAVAAKKRNTQYLEAYRNDVKEMSLGEEMPAFLNYEQLDEASIQYNDKGFVIVKLLSFSYEGGAHGNYGAAMHCFDIASKKPLFLNDILNIDSVRLIPILERNFRKQARLTASEPLNKILFEKHLSLTNNFYFTDKGIGFVYNPYEIAAYAQGIINIFVPYTDLQPYLDPGFAKRMQL